LQISSEPVHNPARLLATELPSLDTGNDGPVGHFPRTEGRLHKTDKCRMQVSQQGVVQNFDLSDVIDAT